MFDWHKMFYSTLVYTSKINHQQKDGQNLMACFKMAAVQVLVGI